MREFFFQESVPVPGRRHVPSDGATVGRGGVDIVLVDPQVSRVHARLSVDANGVGVEDLDSQNGTFVNERRIDALTPLREGDTVRMGDTVWRLFGEGIASTPVASDDPGRMTASPPDSGLRRGDVPAPEPLPSGVHAVPAPDPEAPPEFARDQARSARRQRGSAARNATATLLSYLLVLATAVAVVLYLALR